MAEEWTKYYKLNELKKLQDIEMQNLDVFIEACKKLKVDYFIYGGTLLGAEKFQGLIPWDDDIDVAMPRDSYNRFLQEAQSVLPSNYVLQTPYNTKESPYPYSKLRLKGTKYVEYVHRNLNIENGIYIDIYPVDKIPDDEKLRKKQFKKVRKWILIYVYRQALLYEYEAKNVKDLLKLSLKWILCKCAKIFSQEYCIRKIDYYMTLFNASETKRHAALNSPNYNNIYLKLYPLTNGMFEGRMVKMPGDYKTHLRMRYGDYSMLPPENMRVGHIPYRLEFGDEGELNQ